MDCPWCPRHHTWCEQHIRQVPWASTWRHMIHHSGRHTQSSPGRGLQWRTLGEGWGWVGGPLGYMGQSIYSMLLSTLSLCLSKSQVLPRRLKPVCVPFPQNQASWVFTRDGRTGFYTFFLISPNNKVNQQTFIGNMEMYQKPYTNAHLFPYQICVWDFIWRK